MEKTTFIFQDWLKEQWVKRLDRNPHYSLRAFARDLAWSPSTLSEVLAGKKGVSPATARDVARSLGLGDSECERIQWLAQAQYGRSRRIQTEAKAHLDAIEPEWKATTSLNLDAFRVVSEWYPLAVFELIRMDAFQQNPARIAAELGISAVQVTEAIGSMERLNLLTKKGRKWTVETETVISTDGIPSEALRKFHGQMMDRSRLALEFVPVEERDFVSFILGIRRKDLPEIRKKIRKFVQGLNEEFSLKPGRKGELDHLVSFCTQLAPMVDVGAQKKKLRSQK